MKTRLLIMVVLAGSSLFVPQVWGVDLEKADNLRYFTKPFPITEKQVRYHIPYKMINGTINDMKLNCDSASLVLSVTSVDSGIVKLDVPQQLFSGIFMVLIDGREWEDLSIIKNVLSINFPNNASIIDIRGSHYITPYYVDSQLYTGICDVAHDPPYSYILSPLKQIKNGVKPWMVQCNDGLTLLLKPTEFTKPACVTDETADKLPHRGWSIVLSEDEYSDR